MGTFVLPVLPTSSNVLQIGMQYLCIGRIPDIILGKEFGAFYHLCQRFPISKSS